MIDFLDFLEDLEEVEELEDYCRYCGCKLEPCECGCDLFCPECDE